MGSKSRSEVKSIRLSHRHLWRRCTYLSRWFFFFFILIKLDYFLLWLAVFFRLEVEIKSIISVVDWLDLGFIYVGEKVKLLICHRRIVGLKHVDILHFLVRN